MNRNDQNQLIRSSRLEWQPLAEKGITGIYVNSLLFDDETGRAPTILLKFDAGATYPLHTHPGGEEVFVLEGDIKLGKDELFAGDYLFTAIGGKHCVSTKNGCVVLLKAPREVEIISARR